MGNQRSRSGSNRHECQPRQLSALRLQWFASFPPIEMPFSKLRHLGARADPDIDTAGHHRLRHLTDSIYVTDQRFGAPPRR
jgi:hypothetical protein